MSQDEYLAQADACLAKVSKRLEDMDPDEVDYTTGDGVVTLEFPDGGRFILSRQAATKQMWLAAGAHAWHYNWDSARETWVDDKDGHDLFTKLAEVVSEKIGHGVEF